MQLLLDNEHLCIVCERDKKLCLSEKELSELSIRLPGLLAEIRRRIKKRLLKERGDLDDQLARLETDLAPTTTN